MTAAAATPARSFRVFARIMALSLMFPLDETARGPPKRCSRVQIVSASHTSDKRMSVGKFMRIAYGRQIEIVMRPATFISTLRESHLPFRDDTATGGTRASTRLTPTKFASCQSHFYNLCHST